MIQHCPITRKDYNLMNLETQTSQKKKKTN